ncbi:uncharacterized protein G2W53_037538 [Senna tora]|uniref:Uncharacterized protein n=1 Tax=Senna tora TaxID=362788 RepID=A0A834SKJ7_9FABA|nr:uncharacterized protein G2W53_037538 [Senna tora]
MAITFKQALLEDKGKSTGTEK